MNISDNCHLCRQTNDQMLMLACDHDPCINCAASVYAELVHIKNNDPNVIRPNYPGLHLWSLRLLDWARHLNRRRIEQPFQILC